MFKEKLDSITRERVKLSPHQLSRRSISSFSEEQCRVRLFYRGENLIRWPDKARTLRYSINIIFVISRNYPCNHRN